MSFSFVRFVSRILIVCMLAMPFTTYAGMIGTGQVVSAAQADAARADLSTRLQTMGVDGAAAQDRVKALSDSEVVQLSERMQSLPAGADGSGLLLLILLGVIVWWAVKR
jgi:hypothetical protein